MSSSTQAISAAVIGAKSAITNAYFIQGNEEMKNLARALRHCWKVYKEASREYFAPFLVLWNGNINERRQPHRSHE